MKKELLTALQNILQEIATKEAVIKEQERWLNKSLFNNLFEEEVGGEVAANKKKLSKLKSKYNQLTLKLTDYNYEKRIKI
ncbi:MAG: hypothetical protein IIC76_14955 [Bacteroidetes bacterium]|nr:hypothetical protein [Bacteroidota bacterium]